jgi:hypothetical protein
MGWITLHIPMMMNPSLHCGLFLRLELILGLGGSQGHWEQCIVI